MKALMLGFLIVLGANQIARAESAPVAAAKCETNTDCVPAQCCHPTTCVHKSQAPDCSNIACTKECRPGTLDCGNGHCQCDDGSCKAVLKDK